MSQLKERFVFSAHNLQAYVDCARRFELLYREELAWPAEPVSPYEAYEKQMVLGQIFHEMAQRFLTGFPPDDGSLHQHPEVATWWEAFESFVPSLPSGSYRVERSFASTIEGIAFPLVANYDLVIFSENEITIYDWKTAVKRPGRAVLQERLQTRVYPYLMARLNSEAIPIDSVRMVYWFTNHPERPEEFSYSQEQFEKDDVFLKELMHEMIDKPSGSFALTDDESRCRFCIYRSLCDRGVSAGDIEATDVELEGDLLDQLGTIDDIGEIAF